MRTGQTHFLELAFGELRRLQLDIETYCTAGYEFPSAARPDDRITAIALCDSTGWEHLISGKALSEPEMLRELVRIVRERDPDVIEGHNHFRFHLEYIEARARRHKVPLKLGRAGEPLQGHASRMQVAERAIAYRGSDARSPSVRSPHRWNVVTAAASGGIPASLIDQLRIGARLLIPVERDGAQRLLAIRRTEEGEQETDLGAVVFVPMLGGARTERLLLGWRPLPRDGHPVVGSSPRCPDVHVAVTHSGVTLGPLLGRLASIEILDGVRTDLLQPFRPDRF